MYSCLPYIRHFLAINWEYLFALILFIDHYNQDIQAKIVILANPSSNDNKFYHFPFFQANSIFKFKKEKNKKMMIKTALLIITLIKKLTNINRCLTDPANRCLTNV